MAFRLKTLIVFDTNSLRSTDAGEVAFSFFTFGRPVFLQRRTAPGDHFRDATKMVDC